VPNSISLIGRLCLLFSVHFTFSSCPLGNLLILISIVPRVLAGDAFALLAKSARRAKGQRLSLLLSFCSSRKVFLLILTLLDIRVLLISPLSASKVPHALIFAFILPFVFLIITFVVIALDF
jgi:hypothetical protein